MPRESESIESSNTRFLQSTIRQARLLVRASGSAFFLCDRTERRFEHAATQGLEPASLPLDLLSEVCASRQGVRTDLPGLGAVVAVPALWHDALLGVLAAVDDTPERAFSEHDAALLQPLAELAAAVLHQAARLSRMTAQFRALHVIDVALTSSLQLDRVLNLILEKAVSLVGAEHGSLRLLNPDTGELVLKAHLGEGWTPKVRAYTFEIGHGITGWVAEHRKPYLCPDALNDPQNVVLFEEMRSGVAVPLQSHAGEEPAPEELLGVLLLESTRSAAFDQHDVELLQALAQETVIAIQNATQQHKLQLMHQALQDEQERRVAAEKWTVMGQAATALAHRINNLIGIVPASAAEIRRTLAGAVMPDGDREWIEDNLDRIERNGRFILKLADALFRPFQEAGLQAHFDVNRLLSEALQAAQLPASCQVVLDVADNLPLIESSSLLTDIFLELITNARAAMEGQSHQRLELRTREESDEAGRWVVVQVSDTGRGIRPEEMPHLWDMFKTSADGLGFGLWWVRTFIERQGGSITCSSRPEAGATFAVRLPASTILPGNTRRT